jgi:hypothetical protein
MIGQYVDDRRTETRGVVAGGTGFDRLLLEISLCGRETGENVQNVQ